MIDVGQPAVLAVTWTHCVVLCCAVLGLSSLSCVANMPAGDGRLGLLIAQVCALQAPSGRVTHFGRHPEKMSLVTGTAAQVVSSDAAVEEHAGQFDLVVEASGLWEVRGRGTRRVNRGHGPGWMEVCGWPVLSRQQIVAAAGVCSVSTSDTTMCLCLDQPHTQHLLTHRLCQQYTVCPEADQANGGAGECTSGMLVDGGWCQR